MQANPTPQRQKVCGICKGERTVADYVGLEMKCIEVDCWRCKGTGRIPPVAHSNSEGGADSDTVREGDG